MYNRVAVMGMEISSSQFNPFDFILFTKRVKRETALLREWFERRRFSDAGFVAGFELEAWLMDRQGEPAPVNQGFLESLDSTLVVPELSVFNIEINTPELPLTGNALGRMQRSLTDIWKQCKAVGEAMDIDLMMIGIPPTARPEHMTAENMTPLVRYRALNEQVLRLHGGRPINIRIHGVETLESHHTDILLEAVTTSFQIHLQVNQEDSVRFFNAALLASPFTIAVGANSPFLFGRQLWEETRIPIFEQALPLGAGAAGGQPRYRVSFGEGYLRESFQELFEDNLIHHAPLLPVCVNERPEQFSHLRLHNSTIWRWNRPLIGFDGDGVPHLRLEHRVIPAGPTIIDMMANTAFFYGLTHGLGRLPNPPEEGLPFEHARSNFYAAAQRGLAAEIKWIGGRRQPLVQLVREYMLPLAREGLASLGLDGDDAQSLLDVIEERLASGQNGACWQRRFVEKHGRDMAAMGAAYLANQCKGKPVHEWEAAC